MQFIIGGYDVREPVEVRIMEDRIHIVSYPGPDRSISGKSLDSEKLQMTIPDKPNTKNQKYISKL